MPGTRADRFRSGARPGGLGLALLVLLAPPHPALARPAEGASARDTIPRLSDFVLDGELGEWRSRPTDRVIAATTALPQALVWIGQVDGGIAVAAEIRATGAADPANVRLSVALADAEPPALPPIGWGHQFGFETLESEAECETLDWGEELQAFCARWFRDQVRHRSRLGPLFERRWVVSPSTPEAPVETLAGPTYAALAPEVRSKLQPLEPRGAPEARTRAVAGTPSALGLEVLVPWEAFPPVRALDLSALRFSIGLTDHDGAAGPSAAAALAGLPPRTLAAPPPHRITPCGYGLRQIALFGDPEIGVRLPSEQAGVYMIPTRSGDVRRLIVIDNESAGYQYEPDPTSISPAAFLAEYSALELGESEVLCGPFLAHKRGDRVSDTVRGTRSDDESPWPFLIDVRHAEVRQLEDGDWLVREGPRVWFSYYGSGQCGACPRVGVRIHHVDAASGVVTQTLAFTQLAGSGVSEVEIEVSDDWAEVVAYESITDWDVEGAEPHWRATHYCFRDATQGQLPRYDVCGEEEPVPEPPKRLRLRYERR